MDAPVPATARAVGTTVESITNVPADSVTISTARPAASSRKMPAHSLWGSITGSGLDGLAGWDHP